MSIFDVIRDSVLASFDTSISPLDMVYALGAALLASLFILLIYKRTMRQVVLDRSYCLSLLLVCAISAMMVLTITSNLALSLGMVGALSIVRYRTAVKDSSDTAFLFWSVAAGITSGAGFYLLTVIGCLLIGCICILAVAILDRVQNLYMLVVRLSDPNSARAVEELLQKAKLPFRLSSQVETAHYTEIIYELGLPEKKRTYMNELRSIPNIISVALVDCRKH